MKIALIGPTYPFRGGISHYTSLLYGYLQEKHQVRLYTFCRFYPKLLYPGNSSVDDSKMRLSAVKAIPTIDWANPFSWVKTGLLISRWSPHLLVFPWWIWAWAIPFWIIGVVSSLKNKGEVLFICHNVVEHEAAIWKSIFTKFVLSIGSSFIVHSQSDYENLKNILPNANVMLRYHPSYEVFRRVPISKREARMKLGIGSKFNRVILFFGIVRPYKGLSYLIEAMPIVIAKIPHVCLIIAGEFWGEEEDYLRQIEELHVEDSVKVINEYIPNEEVGFYFSAADVVVLPYVSGTGSGIVQIAFGFDRPVIATRVGCLPEVVGDGKTGYLVEPNNSQAIADAVVSFYKEGKEGVFVDNITRDKKKFSWDRMVQAIESTQ